MAPPARPRPCLAQIAPGMEKDGAAELEALGAADVTAGRTAVRFAASPRALWRVCYEARLVGRVLVVLHTFRCADERALYAGAREVAWHDLLGPTDTFVVSSNVSSKTLRNSHYVALKVKDAVADHFRDRCGRRPSVDRDAPDVRLHVHVAGDQATLSVDASGGAMHRRGYRKASVDGPMQETLAAAIVRFSGWHGERPLWDPMCGSGTLIAEALMHRCAIPAGYLREHFGFERLPGFDTDAWSRVRGQADAGITPIGAGLIGGSDIDPTAVRAARQNLATLPFGDRVEVIRRDFRDGPGLPGLTILCNPPYGLRVDPKGGAAALYRAFGDFLKRSCAGATAYVYFGNRDLIGQIGLRPGARKPMAAGGLDGRCCRFEMVPL
jgi:23S rRNA (guanine2445-N2)-methyltransferase